MQPYSQDEYPQHYDQQELGYQMIPEDMAHPVFFRRRCDRCDGILPIWIPYPYYPPYPYPYPFSYQQGPYTQFNIGSSPYGGTPFGGNPMGGNPFGGTFGGNPYGGNPFGGF